MEALHAYDMLIILIIQSREGDVLNVLGVVVVLEVFEICGLLFIVNILNWTYVLVSCIGYSS